MYKIVAVLSVCFLIGCATKAETKQKVKFYPPRIESHNCTYPLDEMHRNLYYKDSSNSNNNIQH